MSNPDFPGPWQERPGYPDEPRYYEGGYSDGGGYQNGSGYRAGDYRNGNGGGPDYHEADRGGGTRDGSRYNGYDGYDGEVAAGVAGGAFEDIGRDHATGYRGSDGYGRSRTMIRQGHRAESGRTGGPRRPGGPGGRRPGSGSRRPWQLGWWRHWTWRKVGLLTAAMAGGTALIMLVGFFALYTAVSVPAKLLSNTALPQSSTVYLSNGTPVGCFCSVDRASLSQTEIQNSTWLVDAVTAAEDRHYFTEGGISITGLMRAIESTVTGSGVQGASTITEQFVKAYLQYAAGGGNLTPTQKIKEIVIAIKLAKMKSKWWIMTNYLNYIYLGAGANGVEAAAQTYFGKDAYSLDIAQSAMIGALIQEPGGYDPYHPTAVYAPVGISLYDRWKYVLAGMVADGNITQAQADAQTFPKVLPPTPATVSSGVYQGYIMDAVRAELENNYGYTNQQIQSGGLQITTTFSEAKMNALYAAVADMKSMIRQYGGTWPTWARLGAVLENPQSGAIEAMYAGPNYNLPTKQCLIVSCQYNMAQMARNQVGSSFKPYVLAEAVSQGMNVQTSILNGESPICVPPDNSAASRSALSQLATGTTCAAGSGEYYVGYDPAAKLGPLPVSIATAVSSNPAYVDLVHYVGTANTIALAKQFGVSLSGSGLDNMLGQTGIALGIGLLTVQEQASTFATLANNGQYIQPHVISKIVQNGSTLPLKIKTWSVLSPAQDADVDWALSFDTTGTGGYAGTGTNALLASPRPTIAKTGTTDNYHSAFFIGALPGEYSFAVGMFTNSPGDNAQQLGVLPTIGGWQGGYGGAWPAALWRLYMERIIAMNPNLPVTPLPQVQVAGFSTWNRALPVHKQQCKAGKGGNGGKGGGKGQQGCPPQPPSPNPSPTITFPTLPGPTPTATPTVTPTVTPSPTSSLG